MRPAQTAPWISKALWAGGLGLCLAAGAWAQSSAKPLPSAQELRRQIEKLQAEREQAEEQSQAAPVRLTDSLTPPPQRPRGPWSFIELTGGLERLTAIVTFTPLEGQSKQPVRFVLCRRGTEWLRLREGAWSMQVTLLASLDEDPFELPAQEVQLGRQDGYALELTREMEQDLRRQRRWEEQKPKPKPDERKKLPARAQPGAGAQEPEPTPSVEWLLPVKPTNK